MAHSPELKAEVIAACTIKGMSPENAALSFNVPLKTIYMWLNALHSKNQNQNSRNQNQNGIARVPSFQPEKGTGISRQDQYEAALFENLERLAKKGLGMIEKWIDKATEDSFLNSNPLEAKELGEAALDRLAGIFQRNVREQPEEVTGELIA